MEDYSKSIYCSLYYRIANSNIPPRLDGMVLRIQDAPHHQREGRGAELHDHPCGCR